MFVYTDRIDTIVIIDQAGTLIRLYGGRLKNRQDLSSCGLLGQKLHWPAETARKQSELNSRPFVVLGIVNAFWLPFGQNNNREMKRSVTRQLLTLKI